MGLSIPGLSAILRPFLAREKRMAISHCSYICMIEQSGSKDPYAAFGGNMAALQRNQVTVVGLKTHMPPLAEIWLLCSVSSAPVAQMKLHEGNIFLYFRTGPPVVKLSQCPYIATKSRMQLMVMYLMNHKSIDGRKIVFNSKCTTPRQTPVPC